MSGTNEQAVMIPAPTETSAPVTIPAVATFTRYTDQPSTCEPELNEHSGQRVTVLHQLGPDEVDEEVGPMFAIRFSDGLETSAFADELTGWEALA